MRILLPFVFLFAFQAVGLSQDKTDSRELIGHLGSRDALLVLHATERREGGWRVAGEYVVLGTLTRRFLEGERGPELGVTTLKEGTTPILFGRPATGELRGTWRAGVFKGTRYGPGGQERERFDFSEEFPSMDAHTAAVRCAMSAGPYAATLGYTVENGRLKPGSLEWRSTVAPSGHGCTVGALEQQSMKGGLRFASGPCAVSLRVVGEFVKVEAENCSAACASQGYLEPVLVDRRGQCRLLRQEIR